MVRGSWFLSTVLLFGLLASAVQAAPTLGVAGGLGVSTPLPSYRLDASEPQTLGRMPWTSARDLVDRDSRSMFWNAHYRAERAAVSWTVMEYQEFRSVEESNLVWAGNAEVREAFSMVEGTGVLYPGIMVGVELGATHAQIRPHGEDGYDAYRAGWVLGGFISAAYPVSPWLTLVGEFRYRTWEVRDDSEDNVQYDEELNDSILLSGERIWLDARAFIELIGVPRVWALNVYGGVGYHLYNADITGISEIASIHPPSPDDVSVLSGLYLRVRNNFYLRYDVRYPGVLNMRLTVGWVW